MKATTTPLHRQASRPILPYVVLLLGLLGSGNALAAILVQYTYLDPYGVTKTATSTTPYVNPAATVTFALVAGLDRKLEISWIDNVGATVSVATSALITVADRIDIDGTSYYGFFLDLEPPATDGNYTLRARILAFDESQVAVENYPVVVDRTPPALLGDFGWRAWRPNNLYPLPDDTLVGYFESERLWIDNVVDAEAGLNSDNALFQSIWLDGPDAGDVARSTTAVVDLANGQIAIGDGSNYSVARGVHFPNQSAYMLARFVVFDRAGNVANFDKPLYWMARCEAPGTEMFAVFDPDDTGNIVPGSPFTGFVPYVAGMEVKTNPVRMLIRIPLTEWWETSTFGVSFYHRKPPPVDWPLDPADFQDASYAYEEIAFPHVPSGDLYPDYRLASPTTYGGCSPSSISPDLTLAPTAPVTPVISELTFEWEGAGINNDERIRKNVVDTLLSWTVEVEPRSYDQTYDTFGFGACEIQAGDTTCSITGPMVMGDTANQMYLYHKWTRISGADLVGDPAIVSFEFDLNAPTVLSVTVDDTGDYADLSMSEFMTGAYWGRVKLIAAWLEAENVDTGDVTTINATGLDSTDGVLMWKARTALTTLADGNYNLRFYARDNYGNVSPPFELLDHVNDRDAPTIDQYITSGDPLNGARISSLNQVRFKIEDVVDNTPSVTAVRLTGGPLSEDVNLGFYNTGTEYRVEFPMMLPSLESGDYRLYVTAEDDFGNSRTVSAVFDYGPARFGLLPENGDIISLPRINVPTRLRNNNWPLTTDPAIMTDAGGLPVLGQRNLTITLSDDAQGPLVVGSITVNPGATEVYPIYDFTANQSALALPLHFADPEAMTEGRFGTLIVQIDNPDAPVFIEDIEAWDPSPSIEVTQAAPSFAKQVETASFRLRNGGTQKCETLVAMVAGDTYRNLRFSENVAICALEWVALPPDLEAMRLDRSRVGGIIRSFDDSVDLSYQPGLLIKQAGNFVFYPVGAVVAHQVELYDPDPPIITVGPTSAGAGQLDWLPTGSFPTSVGQYVAGYANGRADFKRLGMQITNLDTGMVVLDNTYSSSFARGAIETNIADFEGEENFRVDVRYTNYPAIQSTATVRFVALPKEPVIQLARPQAPNNMSDTVVQGRFGKVNRNEFTFNQATMGNWVVRIYKQEAGAGGASTRTQLGADVTHIAANGDFTVNLGTLEAGVYAIIATATYQNASPDIEGRVEGLPAVIKVYNGDPIVFSLVTNRPTGRPPATATVKVSMEDRKRAGDVGRIEWERSTDGTTFEPIVRHARYDRSFGYGERHATAGEFWYRATTVNRYSGATHRSDPIKIHIYDIPKFTLSGYNYTFTNYPVEWSVVPEEAGRPSIYKWTVRPGSYRAEPVEYVGQTQTFDASIRGSWYITVHARYRDAPDVPGSWRKVSGLLKVAPPYMSRPRIVGPTYVEDSQTYEYRAQTYAVTRGNADPNIRVVGRWELPDGTTPTARTINYTVQPGDAEIKYTAWVQGYRTDTEQTTVMKLRTWEYEFPEFRMYKRLAREYDPVQYSYSIIQTRTNMGAERPIYDWTFPSGASVDQRSATSVIVSAYDPGDYPVSARAYDTRGNEAVLDDTFAVVDPPAVTASLNPLVGDAWSRAPARITTRWYVDGLLSKERVNGITVTLNGDLLSDRVLSSYSFDVTDSGTHNIAIALQTSYGRSATFNTDVTLIDGELPLCTIRTTGNAVTSLRAQASCEIPMGRILSYHWWVTYTDTGETRDLGLRSSAIAFSRTELARGISQLRLVVINDKGQEALPAIWND